MPELPISIRLATQADAPVLRLLHRASLWGLGVFDYSLAEIESIVRHVQTLDPALIESGRYYVAHVGGELAGSGGWSEDRHIHPVTPPANANGAVSAQPSAKMRAHFVSPKYARSGVGRAIIETVEGAAMAAGFHDAEVLATLSGVRFYARSGYVSVRNVRLPLADGTQLVAVHMKKALAARNGKRAA